MTTQKKESASKAKSAAAAPYKRYLELLKLRKSLLIAITGVLAVVCLIFLFVNKSNTRRASGAAADPIKPEGALKTTNTIA